MRISKAFAAGILLIFVLTPTRLHAQTVTYSLGTESDLLDAEFYAGQGLEGLDASGRFVLNVGVNNAGTQAIFWAINVCPCVPGMDQYDDFLGIVNIGDPSSWRSLGITRSFNLTNYDVIRWVPDDSAVILDQWRYDLNTNERVGNPPNHGIQVFTNSFTRMPSNNWMVGDSEGELFFLPIRRDGLEDPNRDPVRITNLGLSSAFAEPLIFPNVAPDGSAVAFNVWEAGTSPDTFDIYVLINIDDILNAPKLPDGVTSSLAPTSLTDPNIIDFRATATANPAVAPNFSQDGSLIFFSEDHNNVLETSTLYESIRAGDWDIHYANPDGTGHVRLQLPDNQGNVIPFPSGSRLTFIRGPVGSPEAHAYAATLVANAGIDSESTSLPEGETEATIGGNPVTLPFTLTDSAVQTTSPVTVSDASGTAIELPVDQVINFPDGTASPAISIFTPINPVASYELPDPATQIPVIRTFGPAGTQFYPPITITISYLQREVNGIFDETQMIPYLYNTTTQQFEPLEEPFLSTVVVDPDANTLTFQTDHFSTYGIGFTAVVTPQRPWAVYGLGLILAISGLLVLVRLREKRTVSL